MPINHAHLRAFNAVAAHGSYTRAAEALHVSQSTLSSHVKELEEHYSVKLFERRGRGVELTESGCDNRLHALTVSDVRLVDVEYVVCLE